MSVSLPIKSAKSGAIAEPVSVQPGMVCSRGPQHADGLCLDLHGSVLAGHAADGSVAGCGCGDDRADYFRVTSSVLASASCSGGRSATGTDVVLRWLSDWFCS